MKTRLVIIVLTLFTVLSVAQKANPKIPQPYNYVTENYLDSILYPPYTQNLLRVRAYDSVPQTHYQEYLGVESKEATVIKLNFNAEWRSMGKYSWLGMVLIDTQTKIRYVIKNMHFTSRHSDYSALGIIINKHAYYLPVNTYNWTKEKNLKIGEYLKKLPLRININARLITRIKNHNVVPLLLIDDFSVQQ